MNFKEPFHKTALHSVYYYGNLFLVQNGGINTYPCASKTSVLRYWNIYSNVYKQKRIYTIFSGIHFGNAIWFTCGCRNVLQYSGICSLANAYLVVSVCVWESYKQDNFCLYALRFCGTVGKNSTIFWIYIVQLWNILPSSILLLTMTWAPSHQCVYASWMKWVLMFWTFPYHITVLDN